MNKGVNLFVLLMTFTILGFTLLIGFKFYKDLEAAPSYDVVVQNNNHSEEAKVKKTNATPIESEAAKAYKAAKRKAAPRKAAPKKAASGKRAAAKKPNKD